MAGWYHGGASRWMPRLGSKAPTAPAWSACYATAHDPPFALERRDFFFESGDVSHRVNNKTPDANTHLLFELLPVDLQGASLTIPRDKSAQ